MMTILPLGDAPEALAVHVEVDSGEAVREIRERVPTSHRPSYQ